MKKQIVKIRFNQLFAKNDLIFPVSDTSLKKLINYQLPSTSSSPKTFKVADATSKKKEKPSPFLQLIVFPTLVMPVQHHTYPWKTVV